MPGRRLAKHIRESRVLDLIPFKVALCPYCVWSGVGYYDGVTKVRDHPYLVEVWGVRFDERLLSDNLVDLLAVKDVVFIHPP